MKGNVNLEFFGGQGNLMMVVVGANSFLKLKKEKTYFELGTASMCVVVANLFSSGRLPFSL